MPKLSSNGLEIEYEQHGTASDPTVILIMGLAAQLTRWPLEFVAALVDSGFSVVTFDNRDIGLSEKLAGKRAPSPLTMLMLNSVGLGSLIAPYKLTDMAKDTLGLLDALDVERAHIVGASMGGMIGQIFCAEYPERVRSFTSIMSSTNNPDLPRARADISRAIIHGRAKQRNRNDLIDYTERLWKMIGTQDGGREAGEIRRNVVADVNRNTSPDGVRRQIAAIVATRDLRDWTCRIKVPSLIIHGSDDPLVPVECGLDVAATIQGSQTEIIEGMGHDLPPRFVPVLAKHITAHMTAVD